VQQTAIEAIGLVAGTLTTSAFVPQVIHVWRTRSTRDLSLGMFVMFCIGVSLWLIYGIYLGSLSLIASNGITLGLGLSILIAKLKFG